MKLTGARLLALGAVLCVAAGFASAAYAQSQERQKTPSNWSYDVDQHGNRVPKGNRVTNADGSWREELKQGNCVTIKERAASGEYKETRQCNPGNPN